MPDPQPLDDATIAEAKRLRSLTGSTAANVLAVIILVLACWRGGVFRLCHAVAENYEAVNASNALHAKEATP